MKYRFLGLGILGWSFSSLSFAMWPVIDIASIQKEAQEISLLEQELGSLKDQLSVERSALADLQGETNFGQWKNTASDLDHSQWNPSEWVSTVENDADNYSSHYQTLLSQYETLHPPLTPENMEHYSQGAGTALTQMFQEQLHHNSASQALASGAYEEVKQDFQNLHDLGTQIGDSSIDPDLKHAVDLNSRVELEVGNISVQELRMLSLLNQQQVQNQATSLEEEQDASAYLAKDFSKS